MNAKTITIAAAIILNDKLQTLLVRKKGSIYFMHVGGKIESNESPEAALKREAYEEIGCDIEIISDLGEYTTLAANETEHILHSHLYYAKLQQPPKLQAELAELKWVDVDCIDVPLAPLTAEISIPWCKQYFSSLKT